MATYLSSYTSISGLSTVYANQKATPDLRGLPKERDFETATLRRRGPIPIDVHRFTRTPSDD